MTGFLRIAINDIGVPTSPFFSASLPDFLSNAMLNKPKNICNAEIFSEISAKTIDGMVCNTRIYISQITTNALLPLCYDYIRIFV